MNVQVFLMDTPIIPGYDILAPLPQGGMSAVFKARQVSLDRVVALKLLPPAMAVDGVDVAKFLVEAKITAQLKHPNIVQVYDFGKSPDGIYYFVMEFVSGYSVADWIRRKRSLSVKDTLLCAHCVAEALNYAWVTFGVVHCDIKPDNVMIDGDGTVKVADLGLARSVRSVMDKAKFRTGIVVGTPYYISPEQSEGRLELDCRADIYSLGAMLYHCLTGKMPFEGLPLLEIMDCQITDQIPDIIDLQPHASMAVACLIEKMMAKNPGHRQKDWPEVIRDMIRARSGLLPEGPMVAAGASTMKRCVARGQYLKEREASTHAVPLQKPPASAPAASRSAEALQVALQRSAQANGRGDPVPLLITRPRPWIKPAWLAAVIVVAALAVLWVNMLVKSKPVAIPMDDGVSGAVSGAVSGDVSGEALAKTGRRTILDVASADDPYDGHTHLPGEISAFVNILFGCNRHCAYCVVPEVRGGEWSRPARDVIAEVRQLVTRGVKEVTLLGQSIMAYGRQTKAWEEGDSSPRGFTEPLSRLLEALNDIPGLCRLRFTSGHPCGCTVELARVFAELPAVCAHLHLPLQSASDRILQRMRRGYTAEDYRAAVRRLREAAPRIVLSTDVIVGFPTETPEEFDMTRAFLEEIGFDNVYIFKYNPRPGTPAAQLGDDVTEKEKLRRNHALLEDQGKRSQAFHQSFVGQACEVLVEGPSLRNAARWSGRTRHNILALFEAPPLLKAGDLVMLRVARATAQALYGKIEGKAVGCRL